MEKDNEERIETEMEETDAAPISYSLNPPSPFFWCWARYIYMHPRDSSSMAGLGTKETRGGDFEF